MPAGASQSSKSATIHSVVVAVRILEFLAERGGPQRVTDIADQLGMTKARTSRHLTTLADLGLVARMPDSSGYRLGSALFRLANSAAEQYEIINVADGIMRNLRDTIREAVVLAIPAGREALIVNSLGSGKPLTPKISLGSRYSIPDSPTAWVLLAFAQEAARERAILDLSEESRSPSGRELDATAMRTRCESIRQNFYEFALDPHDAGFSVLSMPVFNHREEIEGAMTVVMRRLPERDLTSIPLREELGDAVLEVSKTIGSVALASEMASALSRNATIEVRRAKYPAV
jgi:DNA-binding IclR family transcriptional regulator